MSSYIINFKNTSGEEGTVIADMGFNYSDKLNDVNEANVKISGTGESKRGLFEIGSEVYIYRNATLEHHGLVDSIDYLEGGGISVHASGYEVWLGKENGDYANSPWQNTASATIYSAILAESNYLSAGTVEAGTDIDFRLSLTDSLWNGISNLKEKTGQDIGIDYINSEIDILDHKGSSTSVATFNAGLQINNIRVSQSYPLGNDVRVYGKGDGDNQIKSDHSSHGQNQGSKDTYGIIRKIVRDPTVMSVAEADKLADALVAMYKDPMKIYDFEVVNPNQSLVSGDVITLNAKSQGLDDEEVRIVGMERGIKGGGEYLTLQVTNAAYSRLVKNTNEILASIEKNARDEQTHMQGTTNVLTFPEMINANNSVPLRVMAFLPSSFIEDEAGNNRVNTFTLDYDVDPYRKGVGTASETNRSPSLDAGSTDSHKHNATGAGHDHTNPTQTSTAGWHGAFVGSDTNTSVSCASGEWTTVAGVSYAGASHGADLFANFYILGNSGGAEDIQVKIENWGEMVHTNSRGAVYMDGFRDNSILRLDAGYTGAVNLGAAVKYVFLMVYAHTGAITVDGELSLYYADHSHSISTWDVNEKNANVSDSNKSPGLAGNAASHNHAVAIGDGISDAESINASQVSIYLDWYNTGTSQWDNKHSILNTGKTIDTDVDLSDSGTYPDAAGFWRARILTNHASPDLVQGIIKVKHALDT